MNKLLLSAVVAASFALTGCQLTAPAEPEVAKTQAPAKKKNREFLKKVGETMPITQVQGVNGETIMLNNPDKKKLVVLFATWCPDSQRAMFALNKSEWMKHEDIDIVAIAREQQAQEVKSWGEENDINITLAIDPDRSIYSQFAKAGIPRFIHVDEDNKLVRLELAEDDKPMDKIGWCQ